MAWVEKHRGGYRVRYRLDDGTLLTENGYTTRTTADDRATDIESDQRRGRFVDPRLAQTSIDEWIRSWSDAHHVTATTRATYDSHIRKHILPRWSGTALGDIARIAIKGWVNNQLRKALSDKSCQDIRVLFSMILAEAVDEGLIGTNPCRKLRITFTERPYTTPNEIATIAARMPPAPRLIVLTAAYTGMRWGELAGLQWTHTHLNDTDPRIDIDPDEGALHELSGRLELGAPKPPPVPAPSTYRRSWSTCSPPTATPTRTRASCSPAPTAACTAAPTTANASGNPPWPEAPTEDGPRSNDRCISTTYATPRRPGWSRIRCRGCCGCNDSGTNARTSTTSTHTSPPQCGSGCSRRCSNAGSSAAAAARR